MKLIKTIQSLTAVIVLVTLIAMFTVNLVVADSTSAKTQATAVATIKALQLTGDGAKTALLISTSSPVTFTSYKTSTPARLVIDFSQAVPAEALIIPDYKKGPITNISLKRYDTDAGALTRMEISLSSDVEGVITPSADNNSIVKITFPSYQDVLPQDTAQSADAAKKSSVQTSSVPDSRTLTAVVAQNDSIEIQLTGPPAEFKSFRLNKPERVVVDILDTKSVADLKLVQLNTAGIATARIGSYSDKVRVVLDAINGGLPDANIIRVPNGLKLAFPTSAVVEKKQNTVATAPAKQVAVEQKEANPQATAPQVESVDFQFTDSISRVSVKTVGNIEIEQPVKSAGYIALKLKNAHLPKHLQRTFETREFNSPVLRITPIQLKSKKANDVVIRIALKADSNFNFVRESSNLSHIEFVNPPAQAKSNSKVSPMASGSNKSSAQELAVEQQIVQAPAEIRAAGGKPQYHGKKVSLEFADAEVRKIFQLLSEVSNKNFVLGDEVTGSISLKLINVPWDQALDIILDTKGLDKREEGNIILVRGKGKFKSLMEEEVETRKAALKSEPLTTALFEVNYADLSGIITQFNALKTDRGVITSDTRTNKVIVKDVKTAIDDMRKILKSLDVPEKQVMIEARIIEASTSFVRSLGIHWGVKTDPASSANNFINTLDSSFGGLTSTAPSSNGLFTVVPGAFTDIMFGTIGANVKLAMRVNAAATAGLVKIISTPKVATLNNKTAKIVQGQQIPYTSATSDKIETKFIEAALSLEVTPHINSNGTIVMKIDAKNDAPDRQTSVGTPPINKKQATTEMLLKDGETTVIGGIYIDRDTEGSDGVPWLMDIPLLGHLFKSTNVEKSKSELLIFVTPRILTNVI